MDFCHLWVLKPTKKRATFNMYCFQSFDKAAVYMYLLLPRISTKLSAWWNQKARSCQLMGAAILVTVHWILFVSIHWQVQIEKLKTEWNWHQGDKIHANQIRTRFSIKWAHLGQFWCCLDTVFQVLIICYGFIIKHPGNFRWCGFIISAAAA